MGEKENDEDLVIRVREISNGFLVLGRGGGIRLPQKYFPDLDKVQDEICELILNEFEDPEDMEDGS